MVKRNYIKSALCILALTLAANTNAKDLVFGVVPQQSAKKLAAKWTPILAHISQNSDVKLRFATAKNIPTFEKRLSSGEYDIAYMNPYHYVVFSESSGYRALVKQSKKQIKGIIVARKDTPLESIHALHGNKMAFPAPAAFAASIIPRAELAKADIHIEPKYVSSHDSVYLNVMKGFFVAGGGVMRTLGNMPEEVQSQLKVLWTTQPYTPHAVATHSQVNSEIRAALTEAFVDMQNTSQGQNLLQSINFNGFEVAKDSDWNDVRALGITSLANPNY